MPSKNHSDLLCRHVNARGDHCRSLIAKGHDSLCTHHLTQSNAKAPQTDEALAAELLGGIEDFSAAASVNRYLGNLLKQIARKRIHRRDAIAQAYVCQLLLNSLPALERQQQRENPSLSEGDQAQQFFAELSATLHPNRHAPSSHPVVRDELQPTHTASA